MHLALIHPRAKQAGGWQAGQQLCRRGPSGPCGQLTKHESTICPCTDEFREKTSFPLQKYKLPSEETEIIKQEYFFILQAAYFADWLTLRKLLISHPLFTNALINQ